MECCNKTIKIRIWKPSESVLQDMVIEEAKIRLSKSYISQCDEVANEVNGWLRITEEMQYRLVSDFAKKYGFDDMLSIENALYYLRTAHVNYPNNKIFKTVPVYVRENKANTGTLIIGDNFVDCPLYNNLDKQKVLLSQLLKVDKPNLIFAGSHT